MGDVGFFGKSTRGRGMLKNGKHCRTNKWVYTLLNTISYTVLLSRFEGNGIEKC